MYDIYIYLKNSISSINGTPLSNVEDREIAKPANIKIVLKFGVNGRDGTGHKYIDDDNVIGELYNKLRNESFKEYIGIYQNATEQGVSSANKITHKIITFVQE